MTEPHVVDLRRSSDNGDPAATSGQSPKRRNTLAGLALLALGALGGWAVAQPNNQPQPEAVPGPTGVVQAPTAVSSGVLEDGTGQASTDGLDSEVGSASPGELDSVSVEQGTVAGLEARPEANGLFLQANVVVLDGIAQLAGPITLLPGIVVPGDDARTQIRLTADGTVGLQVEPNSVEAAPAFDGRFLGYPLGELNGGTLYSPLDHALGAVAYWSREGGVSLPLPEAPNNTSYLAGAGELGVFRSGAAVVVRHMEDSVSLLTVSSEIDDQPVVHACLHPDGTAVALVGASGTVVVLHVESGLEIARLQTSTPLFGVAWSGPRQLVHLANAGQAQLLVATDLDAGTSLETARLDSAAGWKLTTKGTGC